MRLSTSVTPGARQAARSASWRSTQERTVPFRITSLPLVSTLMLLASDSALRRNASSILALISVGATRGRREGVDDALDALDPPHRVLGARALVMPFGVSFDRDPAVFHDDLHVLRGVGQLRLLRTSSRVTVCKS